MYTFLCRVYSLTCIGQCTVISQQAGEGSCKVNMHRMYSVQCIVYSVQSVFFSVHCTVYNMQCTAYSATLGHGVSRLWPFGIVTCKVIWSRIVQC